MGTAAASFLVGTAAFELLVSLLSQTHLYLPKACASEGCKVFEQLSTHHSASMAFSHWSIEHISRSYIESILTLCSTTLCLLHRAHMPPAGSTDTRPPNGFPDETAYPSRTIAFQAAGMITSIVEALQAHDQLRYTPAFM